MPAERFFYPDLLHNRQTISLKGEEAFHLLKVMRKKQGEPVELINGKSQLALARLEKSSKDEALLFVEKLIESPAPRIGLILCIALPKLNRIEWIIEKGTELGVFAFWLFPGEQSEKPTLSDHQLHRLEHLAISALKQCGRLDLPAIEMKKPLSQWQKPTGTLLFGDTSNQAPRIAASYPLPIFFFTGPEKGFSKKELDLLKAWKATGVSLHSNILRADTAPIAAAAILGSLT